MELRPRLIRPVPPRLGVYFRPGYNDHTVVRDLLAEGPPDSLEGIVFDPCLDKRQQELREEARSRKVEMVLDPRVMDIATEGGFSGAVTKLPGASSGPQRPDDLKGLGGQVLIERMVEVVATRGITAVMAPAHFLTGGLDDPWLPIDKQLTHRLREALDKAGLTETPIYYPLAIPSEVFYDPARREMLKTVLTTLPVDAIWLRVHPFGSRSGATVVRRYIEACVDFHSLQRPLVAEKTGTVGLALLAFGAVGGIESGITIGEHFDARGLLKPRVPGKSFGPQARVYLPDLQAFLALKNSRLFFENRSMRAYFGCRDVKCCRHGVDDMLTYPRRHFLRRRLAEALRLSQLPETLRPARYMEEFLRPATDKMVRAVKVEPALESSQRRLESLRVTLGTILESAPPSSFSAIPEGRRMRIRWGA